MNDDWRVQVSCTSTMVALTLSERLRRGDFEHGLADAAGERVIVSLDGHELFLYAGSRAQAELAARAARDLAERSGAVAQTELRRWDQAHEAWVDAEDPSHDHVTANAEPAEPSHPGYTEYEVRITTASHRETVELAEALREQGIPSVRRWRYLLIGAEDEQAAAALAQRVRGLAPAGSAIEVEATAAAVAAEAPPNPFAFFGGLGG